MIDLVCDRRVWRWQPPWWEDEERLTNRTSRLRVRAEHRKRWYRTLHRLREPKREIEMALILRLRDRYSRCVDLVPFDLTSTYIEGHGSPAARNPWLQRRPSAKRAAGTGRTDVPVDGCP